MPKTGSSRSRTLGPGLGDDVAAGSSSVWPSTLVAAVLISLGPVAACSITGDWSRYVLLVVVAACLQYAVLAWPVVTRRIGPGVGWLGVALVYGVAQSVTLWSTLLDQGSFDVLDLVALAGKVVGVLLFAGVASRMRVGIRGLRPFLLVFLATSIVACLYNLVAFGDQFGRLLSVSSSYQLDFRGFFANRNQFGHFLFLSLVAHELLLCRRRVRIRNVVLGLLHVVSLLLTMSRGSLLGAFVFLSAMAVRGSRLSRSLLLLCGAAALVGWAALPQSLFAELAEVVFRPDSGLAGRDDAWSHGIQVWLGTNVFFGVGSFRGVALAQAGGMSVSEFHSFFLETLVSGGLAELALVLLVLGVAWRSLKGSTADRSFVGIYGSAFLALVLLASVESVSFFTVGFVGTVFTVFFVSIPLLVGADEGGATPRPG
ncbi:O-antigen ligase family protein [Propionicicella superfundia]|uniref:O-antigen ligase family protein n=1 Tax=Propionicicella superfundia TaxID=348582 RepID=UPI0012EB1D9E|nr:O-antigen ligase family protein [Propionicicella superfundia]